MLLRHEISYDEPLADVLAMLSDPAFRKASADAMGTLSLTESAGCTTETLEAEVQVKVPLIGGKLESLMAGLVSSGMGKEQVAGVAWLEGQR